MKYCRVQGVHQVREPGADRRGRVQKVQEAEGGHEEAAAQGRGVEDTLTIRSSTVISGECDT